MGSAGNHRRNERVGDDRLLDPTTEAASQPLATRPGPRRWPEKRVLFENNVTDSLIKIGDIRARVRGGRSHLIAS
jgi:hypothetical protein